MEELAKEKPKAARRLRLRSPRQRRGKGGGKAGRARVGTGGEDCRGHVTPREISVRDRSPRTKGPIQSRLSSVAAASKRRPSSPPRPSRPGPRAAKAEATVFAAMAAAAEATVFTAASELAAAAEAEAPPPATDDLDFRCCV
uniref:Uncharacterized protein n=1 Tax=Oryza glumipatula TaxID=40148 RepID=A0A0D9Y2X8_9ORYZ